VAIQPRRSLDPDNQNNRAKENGQLKAVNIDRMAKIATKPTIDTMRR
jgi:hypothetical protein